MKKMLSIGAILVAVVSLFFSKGEQQVKALPIPVAFFQNPASEESLLLDEITAVPNGAYSVFKLRADYAGSCLRVRRSSDNAESDIGFVDNYLDTNTLTTFCAATDGFLVRWYGQTTTANTISNSTASAQFQIVAAGVTIIGSGSRAAVISDGTSDFMTRGGIAPALPVSIFCVAVQDTWTTNDVMFIFNTDAVTSKIRQGGGPSPTLNVDLQTASIAPPLDTWFIMQARIANNDYLIKLNDDAAVTDTSGTSDASDGIRIFYNSASAFFDGGLQELLIFGSTKPSSTDEDTIRNSQNTRFSVF